MTRAPLDPHAQRAAEAQRAFERALADARSQWNDATRHRFDQRCIEPLVVSGRKIATELADLARELSGALNELDTAHY